MKIFIPTFNRPYSTTTPALLDAAGANYILVLRPSQVKSYRANDQFRRNPHCKIAVLDQEFSINYAREACRSMLAPGEWCLQMDDRIRGFTACEPDFYKSNTQLAHEEGGRPKRAMYDDILNRPVTFAQFYEEIILDSIREAEERGANIVGFSPFDNPAFCYKKWNDVSYTQNKMILLRKTNLSWDQGLPAMEEYSMLASQLLEYGRVLVNKWARPVAGHYEPGGLGPLIDRLPAKRAACADIQTRWPGLFKDQRDGDLVLRWRELDQIERWRAGMRAQGLEPNRRD